MKSERIPKLGCLILLFVLFCIANFASCDNEVKLSPVVKTKQGSVQGITLKSRDGKDYSAYWGIPYAKPPKRFQSPSPAEPWEGVRNATKMGSECLQFLEELSGSEDCLFLNVFTSVDLADSSKVATEKRPVIFYIHGGGFRIGSSDTYGAGYLMDEPVVLVTINYRLLAMGFLNLGKLRSPSKNNEYNEIAKGNMGMKDQVLALKWVQENIHYFGGDPNQVTLFGTSAGAVSVSYHILSPLSKSLFQAAISASGTALNHWAFSREPEEFAEKLATSLNCSTSNSDEMIKCLLEKDINEIAAKSYISTVWPLDPLASFVPTVESESSSNDAFLLEEPEISLKEGRFNKVPWITGVVNCEGSMFHANALFQDNEKLLNVLMDNWDKIAPATFGYEDQIPKSALQEASSEVKKYFLGKPGPKNISLADLYGDIWFVSPARSAALYHAKHSPVYPYIFEFTDGQVVNPFNLKFPEGFNEASHGDDARYAFSGNVFGIEVDPASTAVMFSKKYVKLIASFAETGKPDAGIFGSTWPATTKEEADGTAPFKWFHFLQSGAKSSPESVPFKERMEFWDNLLKKYKI